MSDEFTLQDDVHDAVQAMIDAPQANVSVVHYYDSQITDAQIKQLVDTPVEVLPVPAAGYVNVYLKAAVWVHKVTGYTQNALNWTMVIDHFGGDYEGVIADVADESYRCADLFRFVGDHFGAFGAGPTPVTGYDNPVLTVPLTLHLHNDSVEEEYNWLGGHPDNTLSVRVWYLTMPAAPFGGSS